VELRPLAVELRLGDVTAILKPRRIGEAFAQHEGDEGHVEGPRSYRTRPFQPSLSAVVQPFDVDFLPIDLCRALTLRCGAV